MVLSAAAIGVIPPLNPVVTTPLISNPILLLAGPLQSYNAQTGTAVILGQNVPISAQSLPQPGLTVSVFGTINSNGSLNVSSVGGGSLYVPGATEIFLTGIVKASNLLFETVTVGGVTVDLAPALAASGAPMPPVGAIIQLVGTQPVIGGVILAMAVNEGPLEDVMSANPLALQAFIVSNNINGSDKGGVGITGGGRIGGTYVGVATGDLGLTTDIKGQGSQVGQGSTSITGGGVTTKPKPGPVQ